MVLEVRCNREAEWSGLYRGKVGAQHGDLTNQSRKNGDIVSNKWCYPLVMTNIAIENE
jgi:hypothetical protein